MEEGGISGIDERLRDQADYGSVQARSRQFIGQGLREQVADLSLAGGSTDIEGLDGYLIRAPFRKQQLGTHLRTIPMSDHQVITQADEFDDRRCRPASIGQFFEDGAFLPGPDQGVASDGDE
jgi:hypothetical protein